MSNKAVIGIIIVLAAIGGLTWWSLADRQNQTEEPPVGGNGSDVTKDKLTINHYFDAGKHTIEGTMTLPTPCHSLTHEVEMNDPLTTQDVVIKFMTAPGEGICTQVLSDKFFRVTFEASENAKISATLNGAPLTLIFSETKSGITK